MANPTLKLTVPETTVLALAPVVQRWSELCKQQANAEPSAALRWYLMGRADAHHLDAARIREAVNPSTQNSPPREGFAFTQAYETLLQMMATMSKASPEPPPAKP